MNARRILACDVGALTPACLSAQLPCGVSAPAAKSGAVTVLQRAEGLDPSPELEDSRQPTRSFSRLGTSPARRTTVVLWVIAAVSGSARLRQAAVLVPGRRHARVAIRARPRSCRSRKLLRYVLRPLVAHERVERRVKARQM